MIASAQSSRSSSGRKRRREDEDDEPNNGLRLVGSGLHRLGCKLVVGRVHDECASLPRHINELEDTKQEYRRRCVEASVCCEESIVAFYDDEVANIDSQINQLERHLPQSEQPHTL